MVRFICGLGTRAAILFQLHRDMSHRNMIVK
jgi:hypothetical protein